MLVSVFLETYPLYRKYKVNIPEDALINLPQSPAIHMYCLVCESEQTFNIGVSPSYNIGVRGEIRGEVVQVIYLCACCKQFRRFFFIKFDAEKNYIMKVGQEPPWDISIDKTFEDRLGNNAIYFKRGKTSESQGYGIGAFAYYRRIVEEIIGELLTDIADLLAGQEQADYHIALKKAQKTRVTQDKIAFVKDLLPPSLRPNNWNPLALLHGIYSEGLHGKTDEECIELAENVRVILEFLVNEVSLRKANAHSYTENIQKLLDRRNTKTS